MANRSLFQTIVGRLLPNADVWNEAGGMAYQMTPKHALAQYAATGCLNSTYYTQAGHQLQQVFQLCDTLEPDYIARTALYARMEGNMKDLPALLCAVLTIKDKAILARIFDRVIDNPKMLRNYVQIMRSGAVGRKSLGTMPKRLIQGWLTSRTGEQLFNASVGQEPSIADVIKMVHPKPESKIQEAMFGYLIGKEHNADLLPETVRMYEHFKSAEDRSTISVPDVPFQKLTALKLGAREWKAIARNASWQMTRMNLNTFFRHGVFEDEELVQVVSERLRNRELIQKARVFPYQLMTAWMSASKEMPVQILNALHDAMEIALENVPVIEKQVYVFVDVSGSMHSSVTGYRSGATSVMRCLDVAALVSAALLRKNRSAVVVPFNDRVVPVFLNANDSVMTNAEKLASLPCGGTNCSAALKQLNKNGSNGDLIVYVSDSESWVDCPQNAYSLQSATQTMTEWNRFKRRNPNARMVCINIQPYVTTQAKERDDIINVAGFSDEVFNLIAAVASGEAKSGYWVERIERMEIPTNASMQN